MKLCDDCDAPMTATEVEMYEFRCERCEKINHELIEAWRRGERSDTRLDGRYKTDGESHG